MDAASITPQPMPPEAIVIQMALGAWVSKVISDVTRLNIPDALKKHGDRSAEELVSLHGIEVHADSLERALRVCAGVGLFLEDAHGRFRATELSDVLTSDSPVSVKKYVELLGAPYFCRAWSGFGDAVKTGQPQTEQQLGMDFWQYLRAHPSDMADFGEAMKSLSVNAINHVIEKCDLSAARKVVDVGGGFGHLAVALLEKNPHLRGAVLDMPDLIPMAQKSMSPSASVAARLEYVGGDMFDSVPAADVYFMKHIIHDWDDARCIRLLDNCRRSLDGDGRVICVDAVLPPLGDMGGLGAKLMDVNMLVLIPGRERNRKQWTALYEAAGLRITSVTPIQDNVGTSIIEGVKAESGCPQ